MKKQTMSLKQFLKKNSIFRTLPSMGEETEDATTGPEFARRLQGPFLDAHWCNISTVTFALENLQRRQAFLAT